MNTTSGAQGPLYLNWSAIQPADILLSRGDGKISTAIAVASGGQYSHAAVVVEPQTLFESDEVGVGYSVYAIDRVEKVGQDRILLSLLKGIRHAVVLRLPGLDYDAAEKKGGELRKLLRPLVGREYPQWRELAPAAKGGQLGKALAGVVLRVLEVMDSKEIKNPGPFCSQLLCGALQDAAIKCFRTPRNPATVGPNDFLASEFEVVEGLVRPADDSVPTDEAYLRGLHAVPLATRREQTGAAVTGLRGIADIETAVKAIAKLRQSQ